VLDEAAIREPTGAAQLEAGLVLGIRDYFAKQSLPPGAVIGLSGGVDSAVTAHLATQALGADRVLGVLMPGPFSSDHSVADALALARRIGIETRTVDIRGIYERYMADVLNTIPRSEPKTSGESRNLALAQQNIQSRIRGATLMAVSNAENRLVLATGNKSELSIGYCTLYGDTVGGLAVLGDVYKRDVYALARHANQSGERIPQHTIDKPPSAELAPDQRDEDDLPPYPVLDAVLEQAIEGGCNAEAIVPPPGATRELVRSIVPATRSQRVQAPPVAARAPHVAEGVRHRAPAADRAPLRTGSMTPPLLVTGAAGFIGARFLESCAERGIACIAVDRVAHFAARPEHAPVDPAAIVDRDRLFDWLAAERPALRGVVHLGACTDTTELDTALLERLNVGYSRSLWRYAGRGRGAVRLCELGRDLRRRQPGL
jgi:NAD+ synthetase